MTAPGVQDTPGDKPLVLIIDDDDALREAMREVLELHGFSALTAGDGKAGVQLLAARVGEIAVVLLDLTLPVLRGDRALEEIRRISPTVPVILMSGRSEGETAQRLSGQRLDAVLKKPFDLEDLVNAVHMALGR